MLSIHQRPFAPADRSQPGHWEGDLIVGKNQRSAIGTLVERQTRLIRLMHLPARDADSLRIAIATTVGGLPSNLIRSITWDQGIEMARHTDITADLGIPVYFCDSHSPWQRGSNENANGLLRQYFPKGTSLNIYTPDHLRAVEHEINHRPRHTLEDRSPAELFTALITSPNHQPLRR
jgi:transposase, IS30 family